MAKIGAELFTAAGSELLRASDGSASEQRRCASLGVPLCFVAVGSQVAEGWFGGDDGGDVQGSSCEKRLLSGPNSDVRVLTPGADRKLGFVLGCPSRPLGPIAGWRLR